MSISEYMAGITVPCPKCGEDMEYEGFDGDEHEFVCFKCQRQEFFSYGAFGEDADDDGGLPPDEAADIWRSSGMDEDHMFGYDEETLRNS